MKPPPSIVIVDVIAPTITVEGDTELIVGTGLLIVNVTALDAPPPGAGFTITICAVSPSARSATVSATCSWVELTNVVVRLLWFHWTVEL